jgi:hypothetical protein
MVDTRNIVDNNYITKGALQASINNGVFNLPPIFQKWVALETISDPSSVNESTIKNIETLHGKIRNRQLARDGRILPRNTIVAKPLSNVFTTIQDPMFLFPMLPSAIALPCKPGEQVWVMFEHLQSENRDPDAENEYAYWLCSIVGPGHVEDVNHSHMARSDEPTFIQANGGANAAELSKGIKVRYHFKNGKYKLIDEAKGEYTLDFSKGDLKPRIGEIIKGDEYENIILNSEGSKNSVYEAVPRFKKRPGDVAIEGSNNTLIVLGRDRTGSLVSKELKKGAGTIDIVAGRGQTQPTSGLKILNDIKNEELSKHGSSLSKEEGNPDFKNDKSRIYVSQNTKVDENFNLKSNNSTLKKDPINDSETGDAGIIVKSDKIRIIARNDLQIIVSGDPKEEGNDPKKWASITLKSNGDIVFKPSEKGYIKLGGDDADRGIVCSYFPVVTKNGGIEGGHLLTSMGGLFAGAAGATPECNIPIPTPGPTGGVFSNKVLIK